MAVNALHELLHICGLSHEQSRSDRESYIALDYSVLEQDGRSDFDIDQDSDCRTCRTIPNR
jgi:hypothetical protein